MKHVLSLSALTAAALALLPAAAGASAAHGVVVARSHGKLLVATRSGSVFQMRGRARVGSRLVGQQVVGRANRARIHGVVVAHKGSTMFVSSNHHLLAIHGGSAADRPGTVLTSTVAVHANGRLDQQSQTQDGQDCSSSVQVQATVTAVGAGTITLVVNGQDLTVNLPGGLTLPQSLVGQTVTVDVSIGQSGDNCQGDDDSQGDNNGGGGSGGDD